MTLDVIDKKSLKVMIIDDDEISGFIYGKIIEKGGVSGNHVRTFLKGQEALEFLKNNLGNNEDFPDLILLDINMPIMNGWEFLDSYAEDIWPKLGKKVILCMLSSSVNRDDIDKANSYSQVDDYLSKPLTKDVLTNFLNKHFNA